MIKKRNLVVAALLAVTMVTGCANNGAADATTAAVTTEAVAETTVEATATTEAETTQEEQPEMRDLTAKELVSEMKIGWNLGNTLDSTNDSADITADPSLFETAWGNPYTSQKLIDLVIDSGFNVIRIPVSWSNHIYDDGKYTIESTWMDRVQEVVDYAYNRGVYVIVNLHHETWNYPFEDNKEAAATEMAAVWTQIAERFADYNEHLIFEGQNEPRKIGKGNEWSGDAEGREVVNYTNKAFVDTIRAMGGNNAKRILMIPGYAASSSRACLEAIEVPENDDKIIVDIHAYIPYFFALASGNDAVSTWSADNANDVRDINNLMSDIQELFLDKGTAAIIGEFGAMNRLNDADREAWADYYVTAAKAIGVPCVWWDNNSFNGMGENLGLFRRRGLSPYCEYPDLLNALISAAN